MSTQPPSKPHLASPQQMAEAILRSSRTTSEEAGTQTDRMEAARKLQLQQQAERRASRR